MLERREIVCQELGERYVEAVHESGLRVLVCEKPEFTGAYAQFGTRYGSNDNCFKTDQETEFTEVPAGIAHFLEHKLFESEDGDAFSRYAKTGASANAYTSFDRTSYLFSCTDRFEDSFRILLDFVQSPYFTEQTVKKEQGIIGQEIRMYDDSPGWKLMENLFNALYKNHPLKINIAGTVESISRITPALLYRCYHTFYNLNNMFIAVAGNVRADDVLRISDELLRPVNPVQVIKNPLTEPEQVVKNRIQCAMAVSSPLFAIGFKEQFSTPARTLQEKIEMDMLLELLCGRQSVLYRRLLDQGLINSKFGGGYFEGYGFSVPMINGESTDPDAVFAAVLDEVDRLRKEGLETEDVERVRKLFYGRYVSGFNDVEHVCDMLVECAYFGHGLFDETALYRDITIEDLQSRLSRQLLRETAALSVVSPVSTG